MKGRDAVRAAAALYLFTGIAFGVANFPVLAYVVATGRVPVVFGIDLDGGGAFEKTGSNGMAVLIAMFILFSTVEILAGRWLWQGRKRGAVLGLALLLIGGIFWAGFALPLPWILAILKLSLLAGGWRSLSTVSPKQAT